MKQSILQTEAALSFTKQTFENELNSRMDLVRVSAPIAILNGTGINDDLNGVERTVLFPVKSLEDQKAVVVNSLAKWKRMRIQELEVGRGKGIVCDMRAIRPDEDYSPIHSIYVDQWDWEKRIGEDDRSATFLKNEVSKIYDSMRATELIITQKYDHLYPILPEKIAFVYAEDLLQEYPNLTPKERENAITKKHRAVFLIGIGGELSNGKPHDGRAPDYDDWSTENEDGYYGLNGDILLWHPELKKSFEVSSMGIRVDKSALEAQLEKRGQIAKKDLLFHKYLLSGKLPLSIGGGIGQSRICMFMLRKKHIGEVQVGVWSEDIQKQCKEEGIFLL